MILFNYFVGFHFKELHFKELFNHLIIDFLQMPPVPPPPMDDVYADETLYFERSRIKQLQVR